MTDEIKKNLDNKEKKDLKQSSENKVELGKEPTIEEKLKSLEEKNLRMLAELENQRKRFEKEIKDAFEFGGYNFAKETLSLLDNLNRAKDAMNNDKELKSNKDFNKFLKNIEIIEKDLISIFEKNKIRKIECLNQKFDPNFHQAMLEIEDATIEPGNVVKEIQTGYMFGNRLLRPSFVGISKKKGGENGKKDKK
ncbi:MAG: nucleotide exchange factor GrpE [Pelagibacteraceae bacterium TMED216]|nr:MAG: nucleotide exchange factor GrpE [Pelagibacteraceae bacterium TMED216]|tara:strand:+ start:1020 stop:1601 length:582 start_codon:yes stop_codon:yes gene_type:complete